MKETSVQLAESKIKENIYAYLNKNELIVREDNIAYAEKAFKINGIIRWCVKKKIQKLITDAAVEKHYRAMDKFIKGEINLIWNPKGYLEVRRILNNQSKLSDD